MLKQGNCVKRFTAVSEDKLEANAGESFLIKGLYVAPKTDNDYLTLKVDRKTVGVYRIYGKSGNHLDCIRESGTHKNLMEFLQSKGINCSIPVAEGQTFTVASAGTSPVVVIVYDTYDAGDIRADMPNGTDSKEYMFMQYMDSSVDIDDVKSVDLDTSLSPAEFPDFPCAKAVPANTTIEILGLVGCPVGFGVSDDLKTYSQYVKMIKEREVLFDEDRHGIPFFYSNFPGGGISWYSGFSLIGACVNVDPVTQNVSAQHGASLGDPLLFEPVLSFKAGEELIMSVDFEWTDGYDVDGDDIDLAAIMRVVVS